MRFLIDSVSFNTQPPKGGWQAFLDALGVSYVSTHSRLKAAGFWIQDYKLVCFAVSTHSRLKAAGAQAR